MCEYQNGELEHLGGDAAAVAAAVKAPSTTLRVFQTIALLKGVTLSCFFRPAGPHLELKVR